MALQYTLDDKIFNDSLLSGLEGTQNLGFNACLIGGGAIQYYVSSSRRRSTLDVDLQADRHVTVRERGEWSKQTIRNLEERGRRATYNSHVRAGAEVRLEKETTESLPFFVHLDLYSPNHIKANEDRIREEFERVREIELPGKREGHTYTIEAPEDVVAYKMRRLVMGLNCGRIPSEDGKNIKLIASGFVDDVTLGDIDGRLRKVLQKRSMSMEEIARLGFQNVGDLYAKYKDEKCMYDILTLIEAHRERKLFDDPTLIRKHLSTDPLITDRLQMKIFL